MNNRVRLDDAAELEPRSMPQLLSDDIRRQIIEGSLNPGDALPTEKALMEQYGVSRPTLREALRVLATESLVETRRGGNGGGRVRAPDPEVIIRQAGLLLQLSGASVGDVYLMRVIVEPPAARLVAEHHDDDTLANLAQRIADARAVVDAPSAWVHAADAFHRSLVEHSGNPALALVGRMLATLTPVTYTNSLAAMATDRGRAAIRRAMRSWDQVLALIRAGDGAAAEEHWRRHMDVASRSQTAASTPIRVAVSRSSSATGPVRS
jgi:GntR family transcriptional repressor for pyruvate dehydrogenase complex